MGHEEAWRSARLTSSLPAEVAWKADVMAALRKASSDVPITGVQPYGCLRWAEALGSAYVNKKDYDRAIADFDRAIELDPKFVIAYFGRGVIYFNKKLTAPLPTTTGRWNSIPNSRKRTTVAFNKKDYDAAIADYNKTVSNAWIYQKNALSRTYAAENPKLTRALLALALSMSVPAI